MSEKQEKQNNAKNVIHVEHISKEFRVYFDKGVYLKEKVLFKNRRRYEERKVLKDISFDIRQGEAVGLIGENGCGKSTTLKLLSRILYPDTGSVHMNGRVSALIELGAGFHPDLSGRENIYTNAAIFGLTHEEIDKRLQTIIAFSELEEYIDNPVRTYSSGMYMRLAFSVAINVDADILLIDEILAVGDIAFQAKCFNKLREIKNNGTTIVIVSHALDSIEEICDRSIWINNGQIEMEGEPRDVHFRYLEYMTEKREKIAEQEQKRKAEKMKSANDTTQNPEHMVSDDRDGSEQPPNSDADTISDQKRFGNKKVKMTALRLKSTKKETTHFYTGESVKLEIDYKVREIVENPIIGIAITRIDGVSCYGTNTKIDHLSPFVLDNDGKISFNIEKLQLLPGEYYMDVAIQDDSGLAIDYWREAKKFRVISKEREAGIAKLEHYWSID